MSVSRIPAPETRTGVCPLCGAGNECAVAEGHGTCWCFFERVDTGVTEFAATHGLDSSCLCPSCARGAIPSPCIGVCRLDPMTQSCLGCHRTLAEIGRWRELSPTEKATVLLRLRDASTSG